MTVRQGKWKLIRWFETGLDYPSLYELYDLEVDLGETTNLAQQHPERVKELDALIDRFLKDTGAAVPKPNPRFKTDPLQGWIPKACKAIVEGDVLRVTGAGRPLLATTRVEGTGPLELRVRLRSEAGGDILAQWRRSDQETFPASGQTAATTLRGGDWQDARLRLNEKGELAHLRLYLPAQEMPVEVDWIELWRAGEPPTRLMQWDFAVPQHDAEPTAHQPEREPPPYRVAEPPAEMELPNFYEKYVDAGGFPVVSSGRVDDYALKEAAYLVDLLLSERPDVREAMVASGSRLVVIGYGEFTTDIPEYAKMRPKDYWDVRARGLGGSRTDPVCSCGEENLLAYPGDPYRAECILIHEFAHSIHLRGLARVDSTFDRRLKAAYEAAMREGLWEGAYASANHHEYFAEGVQSWFDNNRPPDHDHNHVDTREELREYDPRLAALCEEVFGETKLSYTKPTTRLSGHLAGYDPNAAPTFRWPERLNKVRKEIRRKAEARQGEANDR